MIIDNVCDICEKLLPNETTEVNDFGKNKDLKLYIQKDPEYNIVFISTYKNGRVVDDTGDVFIGDELINNLDRIWNEINMNTL